MSGKGSRRREAAIAESELEERWENTFGEQIERDLTRQAIQGESKTHPIKERKRERRR